MKKFFFFIIIVGMFINFSVNCFATDEDVKQDIYSSIYDDLSDEVKEDLYNLGLDEINVNRIVDLSPRDFISYFINCIQGKIGGPLKSSLLIIAVIMIISSTYAYFPENEKRREYLNLFGCISIGLIAVSSVFPLIRASMSVIDMTSKFIFTLIPILAGLIAACRNPVMALSLNSITIYAANIISSFANKILSPFMSVFLAICTAGCLSKELNLTSLAVFIKNTVIKFLSVTSSLFIAFLSIKGIFTNSVDTVASKGAKILISTTVPVIGSSLSEAYFAVSNSLSLLKSSVGFLGIIIIALINLPIIIELSIWGLMLSLCVSVSKVVNVGSISDFLESLSCVIKTLNIILIFCAVLFVISTGVMITIKNSV